MNIGMPREQHYGREVGLDGWRQNAGPERRAPFLTVSKATGRAGPVINHGGADKAVCVYPFRPLRALGEKRSDEH